MVRKGFKHGVFNPNPFCNNIITSLPVLIAGLMISSQVMGPSGTFFVVTKI